MAFGWDDAAMILGPLLGGLFGGGGDSGGSPTTTAEQRALQQEMLKLLDQQRGYMTQMDPLRESVQKMAMGMLPIRYQTGGLGPAKYGDVSIPQSTVGAVSSGSSQENSQALGTGEPYLNPGGGMSRGMTSFGGAQPGQAAFEDYTFNQNRPLPSRDRSVSLSNSMSGYPTAESGYRSTGGGGGLDWNKWLEDFFKQWSGFNPAA